MDVSIGGGNSWHCDVFRKSFDCVWNMFWSWVGNVEFIVQVILNFRSYLPASNHMLASYAHSVGFSWNMTLVSSDAKGVLLKENPPPSLCALKSLGCVLRILACSMWFLIALGVCLMGVLVPACPTNWYLIQSDFSMSWCTSLPNLFCDYQLVPIGIIYDCFCIKN